MSGTHTRFTPLFLLSKSSRLPREGSESKTKAPGPHQPEQLPRAQPAGGDQSLGSGGKGGRPSFVETGSWVVWGGRGETPPPLGKSQGYDNIPAQKGTFGLGLELKFETDWTLRKGSGGEGVWREGWRWPPVAGLGERPRRGAWRSSQKPGVLEAHGIGPLMLDKYPPLIKNQSSEQYKDARISGNFGDSLRTRPPSLRSSLVGTRRPAQIWAEAQPVWAALPRP